MNEGDNARLVAWSHELRTVHERLRAALRVTRAALDGGEPTQRATRDLLLFCHGFCTALTEHHVGEDQVLFPAIAAAHPELAETLRYLTQDHSMIAHLVSGLEAATNRGAPRAEIDMHLEGIAAIMESHFAYEERRLLAVLATLELDADPFAVLGPL